MNVPEVSPEGAKRRMERRDAYVYLDVRTEPEFIGGHPPGALNIPVAFLSPETGQMEPNEGFLRVVQACIPSETRIIVGCKCGPRSEIATQMLLAAGYRHAANMTGGFSGVLDVNGQVIEEGWSTLGYPVERGLGGEHSFDSLRAKTAAQEEPPAVE